jgi:hypothetical protein
MIGRRGTRHDPTREFLMSYYNWERGVLKFSVAEFKTFRDRMAQAWNAQRANDYVTAVRLHSDFLAAGKGVRDFDYARALENLLDQRSRQMGRYGWADVPIYDFKTFTKHDLLLMLVTERSASEDGRVSYHYGTSAKKPYALRKKDFAPIPPSKMDQMRAGHDGMLSFDPKERTVTWSVSENNKAVQDARESFVGMLFFKVLAQVNWTRGTGGLIVGNDECNRTTGWYYEGGGGNYRTGSFGPLGERGEMGGEDNSVKRRVLRLKL